MTAAASSLPDIDPPTASVLIVDDSIVARAALGRMVDSTDRFMVAGAVGSVTAALAFLTRHRVDVIMLDLELPGIDGLAGLPDLLVAGRGAKILVVSASAETGAIPTIHALALGAADTLFKPGIGGFAARFGAVLEEKLNRLVDAGPGGATAPTPAVESQPLPTIGAFDIVAIGASTGGIHALSALLRALPPEFDRPIVITQHLPASFMPYFAAQLTLIAGRPCDVAQNHMRIRPGRIVVAPGTAHLCLARTTDGACVRLSTEPAASGCLPSVDPMFVSAAATYGARALGIVLSGMGRDGSAGAVDLIRAGASVVVQDRMSSVVWGMPGSIVGNGDATAVLPPAEIGRLIATRAARS
ncbi:MAG: chemotaxis protein CheB [Pseudomonadota bacterium]